MKTRCPIVCLNSGSSSLKFSIYQVGEGEEKALAKGAVERIGLPDGTLWIRDSGNETIGDVHNHFPDHQAAVQATFRALEKFKYPEPAAAGHRVVYGGLDHAVPERVSPQLLDELRAMVGFAPLHLPSAIQGIEAVAAYFPGLPQIACFDTAFHRRMPESAQRFPLPRKFWEKGLRRYGFHGLSYEYIMDKLGAEGQCRLIIAHLGNGASMAAVENGQPIDTTMGFTPAGGFMMGTRSGDLDPGLLLYLMEEGYDRKKLDRLVNHQAGLLGVSGISSDMKTLLDRSGVDSNAALAVELFCYHVRKQIGALTAVLGGLDTLVFTGGIGERAAPVRWEICKGLGFLGIKLDPKKNEIDADTISFPSSSCTVRVIPTDEDLMIARHSQILISSVSNSPTAGGE